MALSFLNQPFEFDSETSDTFELTYRGEFFGGRFCMDATAFYTRFDDQQFRLNVDPPAPDIQVVNLAESRSIGLELSGTAHLGDSWTVNAGLGLLDTEITDARSSAGNFTQFEDNSFGNDPNIEVFSNISYYQTDELELYGSARYVGEYFSIFENNAREKAGDYGIFDVGASYTYGTLVARAFIRNLTDTFAVATRVNNEFLRVFPPRTFGASLSVKF